MSYYASGTGYAKLKDATDRIELAKVLEKRGNGRVTFDLELEPERKYVDLSYENQRWEEEDLMEFLNTLAPYVSEGTMSFSGEDDSLWRYRFDPDTQKFVEETATAVYGNDLSELTTEAMIAELTRRGFIVRDEEEDYLEVKTGAGTIRAYKIEDPGQPGIGLVLQPAGYDEEIDLALASVYEDRGYVTKDEEGSEDVVLFAYSDVYTEDYSLKDILRRKDIKTALNEGLMSSITYEDKKYPTRTVVVPEFGERVISTETLQDKLLGANGDYVSDMARAIDEEIFFYVPDELIKTASTAELTDYVTKNVS